MNTIIIPYSGCISVADGIPEVGTIVFNPISAFKVCNVGMSMIEFFERNRRVLLHPNNDYMNGHKVKRVPVKDAVAIVISDSLISRTTGATRSVRYVAVIENQALLCQHWVR